MININTLMIDSASTYEEGAMYLNTKHKNNQKRIDQRELKPIKEWLQMNDVENATDIYNFYKDLCSKLPCFSYEQAFKIEEGSFRSSVFSVINVPEMIRELGSTRIKTEGIELINKTFVDGEFINIPLSQIYELHQVNGRKLGLDEDIFAIRCWCTSTNDEHWLWVDETVKSHMSPLTAIASTCKIYSSMVGNIKHIIRQGDVFLFEMIDDTIEINESDSIISLDKETYFSLLKSQS